jgi:hypothetical protein
VVWLGLAWSVELLAEQLGGAAVGSGDERGVHPQGGRRHRLVQRAAQDRMDLPDGRSGQRQPAGAIGLVGAVAAAPGLGW